MNKQWVEVIRAFTRQKILVIGEATADIDLQGDPDRLAREAPVPVVSVRRKVQAAGRAANAAVNAAALGGQTYFLSVIGDGADGADMRQILEHGQVHTGYLLAEAGRRTQTVQRVSAGDHLLVRFDTGDTGPLQPETEAALIARLRKLYPRMDAVLISDYGYGILSDAVIAELAVLQRAHPKPLIIDSKYLDKYRGIGATVVKPNYREALTLLGITRPAVPGKRALQLQAHSNRLLEITGAKAAAVTLDVDGSIVLQKDVAPYRTYSQPLEHSKAVGAGDTFSSALALSLAVGADVPIAADVAQCAASVVIRKTGTTVCHRDELLQVLTADPKYIADWQQLQKHLARHKRRGKRIVFTNGCFDILHSGHVSYLNQAKAQGDVLVVGVNSDASVTRLKGSTRPINSLADRLRVLAGLQAVDVVTSFEEDTPLKLLEAVQPDLYIKGGDYSREKLPEVPLIESMGGEVVIMPLVLNRSTTKLIRRIQKLTQKVTEGSPDAGKPTLGSVR